MQNLVTHPTGDVLSALADGTLDAAVTETIESHLSLCETCREQYDQLPSFVRLQDQLRQEHPNGRHDHELRDWLDRLKQAGPVALADEQEVIEALGPAVHPDDLGQIGRYRILGKLGSGGMGCVFKALHPVMDREVAIKVVSRRLLREPGAVARFQREIRAVAKLHHPNIVEAYDADCAGDLHFLVMELVEGTDLARLVRREGPLDAHRAADFARQAALGLQHAFSKGIVHRDVKPANLMLASDGIVRLLDLGLARLRQGSTWDHSTNSSLVLGTPDFMAPEQAAAPHQEDIRNDIYSLGCTLYYLLTARAPFPVRGAVQKLLAHQSQQQPSPLAELRSDLPPGLIAVVERMMAKKLDDRFATPADVAEALAPYTALGADHDERLPPTQAWKPKPATASRLHRGPARKFVFAAAMLLPILLAGVIYVQTDRGTLEVETVDEQVEVLVQKNGQVVKLIDHATGWKIEIPSGDYQLALAKGGEQLELDDKGEVTVKRGQTTIARLRHKPTTANVQERNAEATSAPAVTRTEPARSADAPKPFVVLRADGGRRGEFKYISEALAARDFHDTIEIHGDGPFQLSQVRSSKNLTLRAAPGYRPVFTPGPNVEESQHWIIVHSGNPVTIEGCDFISRRRVEGFCQIHGGAPVEIRNCRVLGLMRVFAHLGGPKVTIENCLVSIHGHFGTLGANMEAELTNNVISFAWHGLGFAKPGGQSIRLTGNTITRFDFVPNGFFVYTDRDNAPEAPITIQAQGNVFYTLSNILCTQARTVDWLPQLRWQGRENLYVGPNALVVRTPVQQSVITKDLEAWQRQWGDEEGSRHVERVLFAWDAVRLQQPAEALATLQRETDRIGQNHGEAFNDLGPDWKLVGHGAGYEQALRGSAGDSTLLTASADAARVPPVTGAFVHWKKGRPVRAYTTFQEAVNAAGDTDTVEICCDDPVPSIAFPTDKTIHLRAGAGWQPTLEGPLSRVLSVEGIRFRQPITVIGATRFMNCWFDDALTLDTQHALTHGLGEGPCEFENCVLWGRVNLESRPGQAISVRNSVVSSFMFLRDSEPEYQIEFDRCVFWSPGTGVWHPQAGWWGTGRFWSPLVTWADCRLAVTVTRTLFEPGAILYLNGKDSSDGTRMRWKGSDNVYRTERLFGSTAVNSVNLVEILDLDAWRRCFNTEEPGSIQLDPLEYEPLQWKLLPADHAVLKRADGEDFGADVQRIAGMR